MLSNNMHLVTVHFPTLFLNELDRGKAGCRERKQNGKRTSSMTRGKPYHVSLLVVIVFL